MAPFGGSTAKCKSCDKTVHFVEMVSADGVPYHKSCFRCIQCNGLLSMSTYSQIEGVLYCKAHYGQFLKEKSLNNIPFSPGKTKPNGLTRTPSKLAHLFSGTQDKCTVCTKTAYPLEKLTVEGQIFHKSCFKCSHGGCSLNASNYAALDGVLYCKPHFAQLFKSKGSYINLSKSASLKKNQIAPVTTTPFEEALAEEEAAAAAAAAPAPEQQDD